MKDEEKQTDDPKKLNETVTEQEETVEKAEETLENPETEETGKEPETAEKNRKRKFLLFLLACAAVLILGIVLTVAISKSGKKKSGTGAAEAVTETPAAAVTETVTETAGETETETAGTETADTQTATATEEPVTESAAVTEDGLVLTYSGNNSWASGEETMYGLEIGITNNTDESISGWTLVLDIDGVGSVSGWNGTFTVSDGQLTVTNETYNGDIAPGGAVSVGCNLGTTAGELVISKATLNGTAMAVKKGTVVTNDNSGANGNNGNNNNSNAEAAVDVEELLKRSEDAAEGDDWLYTDGNKIVDKDGKEVWITGVNWFGYNTGTNTFDGLWNSELVSTVKAIADHGFNLIRVPMSAELILQWKNGEYPKANYNNAYNTALNSMNSLEIWDYFLKLAEANGIKVMIDIHSAETNASGHTVNLWCTSKITAELYYEALEWMAERYKKDDTLVAIDLKNEPHGKPYEGSAAAIWNDSTSENNWKYVATTAALRVLKKNPNVLVMVEGIEIYPKDIETNGDYHSTDSEDYDFNWWGGNLRGVRDFPIDLGKYQNKLVYSPHDYGPSVYAQPWFSGTYTYESLMKDCWEDNWFYLYEENTAPLLIGEWGGFMTEPNLTWMTYMRQLIKTYHLHHTFWCLNANSGDTGGLLKDDFTTWDEEKYAFVKEVLWQENGKFVGLDHEIPLGENGITLSEATGIK